MKASKRMMGSLLVALLFSAGANAAAVPEASCEALAKLPVDNAEILSVDRVRGGFHLDWISLLFRIPGFTLPPSCRVELRLRPSPQSSIHTMVWMPERDWNGRYQGIGNGGFAGSIDTLSMKIALSRGYAVSATDTGHVASDKDGRWALNNAELIKDYGYRAIHETAVASKAMIAAYYGHAPHYSYFSSGSNGGRQGLMEAQRYPGDYDGILAGCPAADGTSLVATIAWMQQQILLKDNAAGWIAPKKLPAIAAATLAACDAIDGVRDGVIDDPRQCPFEPESMRCRGKDASDCLSDAQIRSLKLIRSGPGAHAGRMLSGYEPGNEDTGLWIDWLSGKKPRKAIGYLYALEFNRYLIHNDPDWTLDRFDIDRDLEAADRGIMGQAYNAIDPDLAPFAARGGKLILYHGWNDAALPAQRTIQYYEQVQDRVGADRANTFVRLYMVPGLEHCTGGPGPNAFGQMPGGGSGEPGSDINAALIAWVEQGIAPDVIVAEKHASAMKPLFSQASSTPLRTRPLCPYPQVARWKGEGSTDQAQNFSCVSPSSAQ
jgi:hypothetical protein